MAKSMSNLREVRVDIVSSRRHSHGPFEIMEKRINPKVSSRSSDFVYVNSAYVGSANSVNQRQIIIEPPTSVIREQYWACSKWPFAQRVLAVVVGVLLGAVIGLAVTVAIRGKDDLDLAGIFRNHAAPD